MASGPGTRAHVVTRGVSRPLRTAAVGHCSWRAVSHTGGPCLRSAGDARSLRGSSPESMPRGSGSLPRRSRVGTASPVGEVAEALLLASHGRVASPSAITSDPDGPTWVALLWGLTWPARCSPPWRHRDLVVGYGQGIPGSSRPTRVFAPQAAGRAPSTCRLDLVGEAFPRLGQSLDGRFSVEIMTPQGDSTRSSTYLPASGVTRRHCLLHGAVPVAPPSVRPDHSREGTPLLA